MFETLDTSRLARLLRKITPPSGAGSLLDGFDLMVTVLEEKGLRRWLQ
jgi:hypothetical protein